MITVAQATDLVGVSNQTIYRWIKQRKVHAQRLTSGQLRLCRDSLFNLPESANDDLITQLLDPRVESVLKLIQEKYNNPDLSLIWLARQVNLSVWHLTRLFKGNTGVGFRAYLRGIRMKKAQELLRSTFLSIKQVSAAVGYKQVSDFDHNYKKEFGQSPKEYRIVNKTGPVETFDELHSVR